MIWLGDYFESTASQRRGALVLLILIALLGLSYILNSNKKAALQIVIHDVEELANSPLVKVDSACEKLHHLFKFNPNTITKEKWMKLGFSARQTETILRYKQTIGGFKTLQDISKCYVINRDKYLQLLPYIRLRKLKHNTAFCKAILLLKSDTPIYYLNKKFENLFYVRTENHYNYYIGKGLSVLLLDSIYEKLDRLEFKNAVIDSLDCLKFKKIKSQITKEEHVFSKIDINGSSAESLTNIRGIGPVLSARIIKYRNSLGGFISLNQLDEVYGLEMELLKDLKSKVSITDSVAIRKLNINQLDSDSLKSHPYINWNLANAIVAYREQHGNYDSIEKIKSIHLLNNEIYFKIAPYLKVR